MERMLTRKEIHELTGFDRHAIGILTDTGLLKGIKTGREWRYRDETVQKFIKDHEGKDLSNEEKIRMIAKLRTIGG